MKSHDRVIYRLGVGDDLDLRGVGCRAEPHVEALGGADIVLHHEEAVAHAAQDIGNLSPFIKGFNVHIITETSIPKSKEVGNV